MHNIGNILLALWVICAAGATHRRCVRRGLGYGSSLRSAQAEEGHVVVAEGDGKDESLVPRERRVGERSRWARGQGNWAKPEKSSLRTSKEDYSMDLVHAKPEGQKERVTTPLVEEPVAAEGQKEGKKEPVLTKKRVKKFFQRDFDNSSWTVAIQWKSKPYEIVTTKVFLKDDGTVVWLNRAKGEWKIRPKTRNISIYRRFFWNWNGMRIFSARLLENTCDIYLEGDIKGWTPFAPLEVMGWFQAVRRGIVVDDNTPRPPWEDREAPSQKDLKRKRFTKEIIVPVDVD